MREHAGCSARSLGARDLVDLLFIERAGLGAAAGYDDALASAAAGVAAAVAERVAFALIHLPVQVDGVALRATRAAEHGAAGRAAACIMDRA